LKRADDHVYDSWFLFLPDFHKRIKPARATNREINWEVDKLPTEPLIKSPR